MILQSRGEGLELGDQGTLRLVTRDLRLATELLETGDHEPIGLARERRRKNRVPFRVSRQLLGERDEVPALQRYAAAFHLWHECRP